MDGSTVTRALLQKLQSLQRAGVAQIGKIPAVQQPAARLQASEPAAPSAAAARQQVVEQLSRPDSAASQPQRSAAMPRSSSSRPASPVKTTAAAATPALHFMTGSFDTPPLPAEQRLAALEVIRAEVAGCTRCAPLARARQNTVFGVGNPSARLCFFGEAPGADEDRQGIPFVGRAGQLLDKIIEACTFRREDVFILNVLKCRPPDNRPPEPDEVANCRGYFERQLEIIRPEFICCLGATASKALLNTDVSIGRLRGKFHDYRGIPTICTYHPSYLLRNPAAKRDVWEDMKMLLKRMGIEVK